MYTLIYLTCPRALLPAMRSRPRKPAARALSMLVGSVRDDFGYMDPAIAFLNNGSFGAAPRPVLKHQHEIRTEWLRHPDKVYFGGELSEGVELCAQSRCSHSQVGCERPDVFGPIAIVPSKYSS